VLLKLLEETRRLRIGVPALRSNDYVNTISTENEPWSPGAEDIERRIRRIIRWNAAVMVTRANRPEIGVGGHIATYQSAASLYEVGFNHFFRGKDHPGGGDQVFIQGHASPGIYARAFLDGRLSAGQLDGFRLELSRGAGQGLSSYPHPRLMPHFWEFPTVSMGLGPINAIYQARFNKYLHARGIKDTSQQRVWAFLGDGEMDEPESLGAIGLAAREELDNLTFVVNCNLQRLDGPVRGNGKVIQELEAFFRGAGWNVIKVVWGREWDRLHLPISDDRIEQGMAAGLPPHYHPGAESEEVRYLLDRRRRLGGFVPERRSAATPLTLPGDNAYAGLRKGSSSQPVATTMAFVRLLKELMRDTEIGPPVRADRPGRRAHLWHGPALLQR
jgi:pyruvate dehydrogenase complex dehydrogenase (E1) component